MKKVYDKCCGIDVHKKLIVACFKKGNTQEIREFGATTRELLEMADDACRLDTGADGDRNAQMAAIAGGARLGAGAGSG